MTEIQLYFATFFIHSAAMNFKKRLIPVKFLLIFGQKQKVKMSSFKNKPLKVGITDNSFSIHVNSIIFAKWQIKKINLKK